MIAGCWSVPETTGEMPRPCAAASFTKVDQHTAVLFGGRQKEGRVYDLAILNMEKWVKKLNECTKCDDIKSDMGWEEDLTK